VAERPSITATTVIVVDRSAPAAYHSSLPTCASTISAGTCAALAAVDAKASRVVGRTRPTRPVAAVAGGRVIIEAAGARAAAAPIAAAEGTANHWRRCADTRSFVLGTRGAGCALVTTSSHSFGAMRFRLGWLNVHIRVSRRCSKCARCMVRPTVAKLVTHRLKREPAQRRPGRTDPQSLWRATQQQLLVVPPRSASASRCIQPA
jgi:hypothetical protein